MLNTPIETGTLELSNRVFLAPLAGVSDVPFRRICQEMGAGLTYVEMLAANLVIHGYKRNRATWARHHNEEVLGVQVTGKNAEEVAGAVRILEGEGFDTIDINMGCPVKKIVRKGGGSAILQDLERISRTVEKARETTGLPLSAKIRLGFTRDDIIVEDAAARIAQAGADMITIHGRTRDDNYGVPVDMAAIQRGLQQAKSIKASIVTVGNGDVMNPAAARTMHEKTACDAVMVSRGALGNPWIFREILTGQRGTSMGEWLEILFRHLDYHEAHYGESPHTALTARKHLLWYTTGFPEMRRLRSELSTVEDLSTARKRLLSYASGYPAGLLRFENELEAEASFEPKYAMDRAADRPLAEEI
ncbi:MAG: tRNA-dihydrouridine synthase [Verrucomicrobia bacterium]|nr:tRNA-dihydrouridine synthase [Verrucomicrobiota bacterium]